MWGTLTGSRQRGGGQWEGLQRSGSAHPSLPLQRVPPQPWTLQSLFAPHPWPRPLDPITSWFHPWEQPDSGAAAVALTFSSSEVASFLGLEWVTSFLGAELGSQGGGCLPQSGDQWVTQEHLSLPPPAARVAEHRDRSDPHGALLKINFTPDPVCDLHRDLLWWRWCCGRSPSPHPVPLALQPPEVLTVGPVTNVHLIQVGPLLSQTEAGSERSRKRPNWKCRESQKDQGLNGEASC